MPLCQVFGSYVYSFGNLTPTLLWLWKWSSASSTWFTHDMNMVRRCEVRAPRGGVGYAGWHQLRYQVAFSLKILAWSEELIDR